jgi:tetratricopeptide (TPR) repeat protein
MRTVGKAVVALALAGTLTLGAAIAFEGSGAGTRPPAGAGSAPAAGALLLPSPAAVSLQTSIADLQERLRTRPGDFRGFAALGLAYVAQARVTGDPTWYPLAEGALLESIRLNERDNEDALLGLGSLALARHDFGRALGYGRRAAELNPYGADAYGVIGDALVELGRYEAAFGAFQTMVDTRPDLASYARVSYARELLGDVPGAIDAMELAFGAAGTPSDRAWTAYRVGELALGSGDVEVAEDWYQRGRSLDRSYVPNLAGLARVAWARGDAGIAIERLEEVVAAYPAPEYVIALGDLYRQTGRSDLAAEQDEVVRAMHELAAANGVNVDLELALFDADHGEPRAALTAARAEWERRHSVHVADALAWALYANGRYREAAAFAERALALGTRSGVFHFHAGMIRLALGDEAGARSELRRALELDPYFSIAHAPLAERTLAELEDRR